MAGPTTPATFDLILQGDDLVRAAQQSSDGLQKLKQVIDADVKALRELQKAQRDVRTTGLKGSDLDKGLSQQIAEIKGRNAKRVGAFALISQQNPFLMQPPEVQPKGVDIPARQGAGFFPKVEPLKPTLPKPKNDNGVKEQTLGLRNYAQALGQIPGPLGMIAQKTLGVSSAFQGMNVLVTGSLVGVAALTTAVIAGTAALTGYAIAASQANKQESIRLRAFGALRKNHQAYTKDVADGMQATIQSISETSALSAEQVSKYASMLVENGVRPEDLNAALRATTEIAATQGDKYANEFANKVAANSKAKLSITNMTTDVHNRLGGLAAEAFNSVSVQWQKFKDKFSDAISSANLDKLNGAIAQLGVTFTQLTGKDATLQNFVQSMVDGVAYGVDSIHLAVLNVTRFMLELKMQINEVVDTINPLTSALGFDLRKGNKDAIRARNREIDASRTLGMPSGTERDTSLGFFTPKDQDEAKFRQHSLGTDLGLSYALDKTFQNVADHIVLGLEQIFDTKAPSKQGGINFLKPAPVSVQVIVNGNASKEDADAIGKAAGDATGKELQKSARRMGL